jgi:adenine-specific DNA-methyltransferase
MPERENTVGRARALRQRSTDAERLLWNRIRDRRLNGVKFRRQHSIAGYIVDFCCVQARLVVELDGGQHAERTLNDRERTTVLEAEGYRVIRFWNHEVLTVIDVVLTAIMEAVPSPLPSPLRGEGSLETLSHRKRETLRPEI